MNCKLHFTLLNSTYKSMRHVSHRHKFTLRRRTLFHSLAKGSVITYHQDISNYEGILIILSGWLGGKPQHLQKYVNFWTSKGFDVLAYQTRWRDLMFPTKTFDKKALHLVETIHESRNVYPKIMFHTLSSGCYLYASVIETIIQRAQFHHCRENIKGVIYDSLADWPHTLTTRKSLTDFLGPKVDLLPVETVRNHALPAFKSSANSFPWYLCMPPFNFDKFQDKNRTIYANPFNIPGLFLFSDDDLLCHAFQIRRIVDHWAQRKIFVAKHHWPDSDHVQHYRLHRAEYDRQVELFIARTLQINMNFRNS